MGQYKLICVVGARPNFMKLAPLLKVLDRDRDFNAIVVHTGQHYDEALAGWFFRDLALRAPDYQLKVGPGSHVAQTAEIMKRFEPVVDLEHPDAVIVVGDVNSTMAAALVAAKMHVPVIHIEAGLRSFDRSMPEEINRVITDAIADLLLVTEESGRRNLIVEGVSLRRIHLVGNLMIDSLRGSLAAARTSDILQRLNLTGRRFGLITLHRPANVDNREQFKEMMSALAEISRELPLVFPVHPRTKAHIEQARLSGFANITMIDPLGYLDFLWLMSNSSVVLTDSGGIQEETTSLGVPCLTLRNNTERPVTVEQGTNTLVGTRRSTILAAWHETKLRPKKGRIPALWDGRAAERCRVVLRGYFDLGRVIPGSDRETQETSPHGLVDVASH